ncbi:hypothetical protein ACTFIU_001846 [Dictyostelium citrinum]
MNKYSNSNSNNNNDWKEIYDTIGHDEKDDINSSTDIQQPKQFGADFINGSLVYTFDIRYSYFTRFIMYQNKTTPRTEMAPNYFDCSKVGGDNRYCVFHSEEPLSRFWGSGWSKACGRNVTHNIEQCTFNIISCGEIVAPTNVVFSRYPPTSGGDVVFNGLFLRVMGGPNYIFNDIGDEAFKVKGNFSDPSFNVNNITVTIPPGSGKFRLFFDESGTYSYYFSYAAPIISSIIPDLLNQVLIINGDNYFTNNSTFQVSIDGVNQNNIGITVNHTQIKVGNFYRVDPGPMSVGIVIKQVSIEKNFIYCFPATITSITSVSNHIGGIVTIKGSKLSSTSNSSLIPTITIGGDRQCKFIKSTTTELECQLDPNESGGKNLSVDVNFGGCNSTSSGDVTFTYNIPTISSASYSNGIVTLIGSNLDNGINNKIKIEQFNVSFDEKIVTFHLPHLRYSSLSTTPSISVGNSTTTNECSIPFLKTSTSDYYETTCSIPYGTGINKIFLFKLNSESVNGEFSYAPPKVESYIQLLNNDQFTFKRLDSYENGPINITVDGNSMEFFYLTLPPFIYGLKNKDNKTLGCGGIITVSDEKTLIVRADSKESPLILSIFIGKEIIKPNVTITYLEPIITVIPSVINNRDGISIKIGGISLSENIKASLTPFSSDNIPLECNLQCCVAAVSALVGCTVYFKVITLAKNSFK